MNNIIHRINSHFFFLSLVYFIVGAVILILICRGDAVLFLNKLHTPFWDQFFKYATHMGGGLFVVLVFILFLIFAPSYKTWVVASSFSLMGIISQLLKKQVFPSVGRPKEMFWMKIDQMNLVEGVKINADYSFPSGHTAAAFIIALMLAWHFKKVSLTYLFFGLALLVGISRIYLFQHFFIDTYFGTLLSFLIGHIVVWFFESKKWSNNKMAQKKIIDVFTK